MQVKPILSHKMIKGVGLSKFITSPHSSSYQLEMAVDKQTSQEYVVRKYKILQTMKVIEINRKMNQLDEKMKNLVAFPDYYSLSQDENGETTMNLFYPDNNKYLSVLNEDFQYRLSKLKRPEIKQQQPDDSIPISEEGVKIPVEFKSNSTKIINYSHSEYESLAISTTYIYEILFFKEKDLFHISEINPESLLLTQNFEVKLDFAYILLQQQLKEGNKEDSLIFYEKSLQELDGDVQIPQLKQDQQEVSKVDNLQKNDDKTQQKKQNIDEKIIEKKEENKKEINLGKIEDQGLDQLENEYKQKLKDDAASEKIEQKKWNLNQQEVKSLITYYQSTVLKRYVIMLLEMATFRPNEEVKKCIFKQNDESRSSMMMTIQKQYSGAFSEFLFTLAERDQTEYKTFEQIRRILKRSINPSTTDLWEQRFTWLFSTLLFYVHVIADIMLGIMLIQDEYPIHGGLLIGLVGAQRIFFVYQSQYEDVVRYSSLFFMDQLMQLCSKDFNNDRKHTYNIFQQIFIQTIPSQMIIIHAYFLNYYQSQNNTIIFALIIGIIQNSWGFLNYYKLKYKYEQIVEIKKFTWNKQLLGPMQLPLYKDGAFEDALGIVEEKNETLVKGMINNTRFQYEKEILKQDIRELPYLQQIYIFIIILIENTAKIFGFGIMTALYRPYILYGYLIAVLLIFFPKILGFFKNYQIMNQNNRIQDYLRKAYRFRQSYGNINQNFSASKNNKWKNLKQSFEQIIVQNQLVNEFPRICLQNDDAFLSDQEILDMIIGNYTNYVIIDRGSYLNLNDDVGGFIWKDNRSILKQEIGFGNVTFVDPTKLKQDILKKCTEEKSGQKGMTVQILKEIFKVTPQIIDNIKAQAEGNREPTEQGYYLDMGTLVNASQPTREKSTTIFTIVFFPILAPIVLYMYIGYLRFEEILFLDYFRDGDIKAWQIPSMYALGYRALELIFFGVCGFYMDTAYVLYMNIYTFLGLAALTSYLIYILDKKFREVDEDD